MLMRKAHAGGLCGMLMWLLMRQAFAAPYALTQSASAAKTRPADTIAETLSKEHKAKIRTDREGETDPRIEEQKERQTHA